LKFYSFFFKIYDFFVTRGKLNNFQLKKSHHFVEHDELILKMYTVLEFAAVFHKLIEENWKQFCVEISTPYFKTVICSYKTARISVHIRHLFIPNVYLSGYISLVYGNGNQS